MVKGKNEFKEGTGEWKRTVGATGSERGNKEERGRKASESCGAWTVAVDVLPDITAIRVECSDWAGSLRKAEEDGRCEWGSCGEEEEAEGEWEWGGGKR